MANDNDNTWYDPSYDWKENYSWDDVREAANRMYGNLISPTSIDAEGNVWDFSDTMKLKDMLVEIFAQCYIQEISYENDDVFLLLNAFKDIK